MKVGSIKRDSITHLDLDGIKVHNKKSGDKLRNLQKKIAWHKPVTHLFRATTMPSTSSGTQNGGDSLASSTPSKKLPRVTTPSLQVGFNAKGVAEVSILREAPPIKQLVLQGGGARGVVYPSFLMELEKKNPEFISNIDTVAGSSAGSMMALLLAAGTPLKEIEQFVANENSLKLMWGDKTDATRRVQLNNDGLMSGIKLRQKLHEMSSKSVNQYFQKHIKGNESAQAYIKKQYGGQSFLQRAELGFPHGITFNDLKILHALNPKKFKLLHVTAFDKDARKVVPFDGDNPKTRNIPCFEAVGASISIPLVFRSVKIRLEGETRARTFVDGGVGSNNPIEIVRGRPEQKMLLHFDRNGEANQILHGRGIPARQCKELLLQKAARKVGDVFKSVVNKIAGRAVFLKQVRKTKIEPLWYGPQPSAFDVLIAGREYPENARKDALKAHRLGINAVVVPHGTLGSLSFAATQTEKQRAVSAARRAAVCYADNVRGSGVSRQYQSIKHALSSLSEKEIRDLNEVAKSKLNENDRVLEKLKRDPHCGVAQFQRQIERNKIESEFYHAILNWCA